MSMNASCSLCGPVAPCSVFCSLRVRSRIPTTLGLGGILCHSRASVGSLLSYDDDHQYLSWFFASYKTLSGSGACRHCRCTFEETRPSGRSFWSQHGEPVRGLCWRVELTFALRVRRRSVRLRFSQLLHHRLPIHMTSFSFIVS